MQRLIANAFLRRNSTASVSRVPTFATQTSRDESNRRDLVNYSFSDPYSIDDQLLHSDTSSVRNLPPRSRWRRELLGLKSIFFKWLNILLFIVPVAIASPLVKWPSLAVMILNGIAIAPLAALIGVFTEEIAIHTGDVLGGLLNASFGNAVELIIAFQTIQQGLLEVVKQTLIGSILSNLLLVLGMSLLAGGMFFHTQKINAKGATCGTSLLLLATLIITIPSIPSDFTHISDKQKLQVSRYNAILIACTYWLFLVFQLYTHISLFKQTDEDEKNGDSYEESEVQSSRISVWTAGIFLASITVLVSFLSDAVIESIEPVVINNGLSKDFIGMILLPLIGNAAEHLTAVTVATKNKLDLSIGVAIGSSVQIALLVIPFAVLFGWLVGQPLSLAFPPMAIVILLLSLFAVKGIIDDGETHWLEGLMLLVAYASVVITYWIYPSSSSE